MKVNKLMKRTALAAAVLLAAGALLSGCGNGGEEGQGDGVQNSGQGETKTVSAPVKIAALNGPTGMGLAPLMENASYEITVFQSPDEVVGKVLSGEFDLAAVPSNMGSVLYNKTEGQVRLAAVNTGGVLYLLENGDSVKNVADLKGKTIYASGKGGAPEYILNRILLDAGLAEGEVTIQWLANHSDVASTASVEEGAVALLPEPFVTVTTAKNPDMRTVADLNAIWMDTYNEELPMGVMIASKAMAEDRGEDLQIFLRDYKEAVNFVNANPSEAAQMIADAEIVADAAVAEKAIPRCNIIFLSGSEAESALNKFYSVLFEMEPKSLGGKLPDETFYYNY